MISSHKVSQGDDRSDDRDHILVRDGMRPMVIPEPFPHIVVDKALPAEIHTELCRTIPNDQYLVAPHSKGPNRYHRRSASELLGNSDYKLSEVWRRFIRGHLGRDFYQTCLSVFAANLHDADATVRAKTGHGLGEIAPAMRGEWGSESAAAWLECQISHVTPTDQPGTPLGPHVDREVALWAGLYYLNGTGPDAGGDLVFYRFRNGFDREYWKDGMIPPSHVEPVKKIAARANRLVMFLHGPDAIHGVTPRLPGYGPRQSVNLVCEFPFKIWDIESHRRNRDRFPGEED